MTAECYFCNGLVLSSESDGILLEGHGDHEVYMHERCAVGQGAVAEVPESSEPIEVTCPECGAVETTMPWARAAERNDTHSE